MTIPTSLPRLKGFSFLRGIIAYAVWVYHRFAISRADVEDLVAERGVIVSHEAIRLWVNRFGSQFAACIPIHGRKLGNASSSSIAGQQNKQWRELSARVF